MNNEADDRKDVARDLAADRQHTEERRVIDNEWKQSVDEKLGDGVVRFTELTEGQHDLLAKLNENTTATFEIGRKLDLHVKNYGEFTRKVQPAVDAIETMQAGVHAIGVFGGFIAWCGRGLRKTIVWIGPIFAFFIAVWGFFHERSAEAWHYVVELFK